MVFCVDPAHHWLAEESNVRLIDRRRLIEPFKHIREFRASGWRDEDRPRAETRLEDPPHDQPALGDEHTVRPQQLGVSNVAIERETRIGGGIDHRHSRRLSRRLTQMHAD